MLCDRWGGGQFKRPLTADRASVLGSNREEANKANPAVFRATRKTKTENRTDISFLHLAIVEERDRRL